MKHRETYLLRAKEYCKKHQDVIKARTKKWYAENKDDPKLRRRQLEYSHKHYFDNQERKSEYSHNRWLKMRLELLEYLGGKCERCGFDDYRALQIDHVNGGGVREMKNLKSLKSPIKYLERIKNNRSEYQLLCANCNWIKRDENNETAKKRIKNNKGARLAVI